MTLSRRRKRRLDESISRVGQLLVVAGPSGAGKATFMRALAGGELPAAIACRLPAGAGRWLQAKGTKILANGHPVAVGSPLAAACLHYDILRPFASEIPDYRGDPALCLLDAADRIIVVMVTAPPQQLARQLLARSRPERGASGGFRLPEQVRARLPGWLWEGAARLVDPPRRRTRRLWRQRHLVLSEHYRQPGWLDGWYARWARHLDSAAGLRLRPPVMHLRPVLTPQRTKSFEMIEVQPMLDPALAACGGARTPLRDSA